jgi:hypothetical protein
MRAVSTTGIQPRSALHRASSWNVVPSSLSRRFNVQWCINKSLATWSPDAPWGRSKILKVRRSPKTHAQVILASACASTIRTWQNGHVERLIGSIRRECLDHVVVFGEAHLRRVLKTYASYYNKVRTRLSLDKNAPDFRRPLPVGDIAAIPILGGLHHQYVRH